MKIIIVLCIGLLSGCGVVIPMAYSEKNLSAVAPGDSRERVQNKLGAPDVVRAAQKMPDGRVLVADEYRLYTKNVPWINLASGPIDLTISWWIPQCWLHYGIRKNYFFTYIDGKLFQYGQDIDWHSQITQDVHVYQETR